MRVLLQLLYLCVLCALLFKSLVLKQKDAKEDEKKGKERRLAVNGVDAIVAKLAATR
jgi:hypothetical protein